MKFIGILSVLFFATFATAEITLENTTQKDSFQTQSSSHYFNFGRVLANTMSTTTYTVTNTGSAYLQFASANIWGIDFSANHNCFSGIYPGQRCNFQIRYWPYNVGVHSGQFEIRFYGPTPNPEIIHVNLWGEAVRY